MEHLLSEYAEKDQYSALMKTTLELALLLIDGGLNRCRTRAKMRGEEIELPTLPSTEDLQEVMTFEDLLDIQQNIFAAFTVGSARNVEARSDNSPKKRRKRHVVRLNTTWFLYYGRKIGMDEEQVLACPLGNMLDYLAVSR